MGQRRRSFRRTLATSIDAPRCEHAHIGTTLIDPNVDYATVARGMGIFGEGPVTDPKDLAAAFKRALAVVRRGEPALVDVVTDPR